MRQHRRHALLVALAALALPAVAAAHPRIPSARAAAAAPYDLVRFRGSARNGRYTGTLTLDLTVIDPATRRVLGLIKASDGLAGQGALTGTLSTAGALHLEGVLRYEMPVEGSTITQRGAFEITLEGQVANGRVSGSYQLQGIGAGGTQTATYSLTATGRTPATAVDPRLVGTWGMIVPGAAWTNEWDRGSYIERVNHVSVGAPAGALLIKGDGSYEWRKRSGTSTGRLVAYAPVGGGTGFLVHFGDEWFYAQYVEGRSGGGFYLFSPKTEFHVYEGRPVR